MLAIHGKKVAEETKPKVSFFHLDLCFELSIIESVG